MRRLVHILTLEQFQKLSEKHDQELECYCEYSEFLTWQNYVQLPNQFRSHGHFDHKEEALDGNFRIEYHPNGTNYGSKDAPIAVNYYPYNISEIHECLNCHAVFLTYVEIDYHSPQNKVKYVSSQLIDGTP